MAPPPDALRRALAPLLDAPATTAILTDFDGTLAPIVDDPGAAAPLPGATELLVDLASRFGVVAVVSGRPVAYLEAHLDLPPASTSAGTDGGSRRTGPSLIGLYGLERAEPDGRIVLDPAAKRWLPTIADSAARLAAGAPPGVLVEAKGATVAVHWRLAPEAAAWAEEAVTEETERNLLRAYPGRMSAELRPPLDVDKGSVVAELARDSSAACYFGDDLGDLPAFAALADLRRRRGVSTVSIGVVDDETPIEIAEAADVAVPGPGAALEILAWLADESQGRG
ncbi:MAG: trehalose-phosphatase [Acidimicrobiales bacterium]